MDPNNSEELQMAKDLGVRMARYNELFLMAGVYGGGVTGEQWPLVGPVLGNMG